MLFADDAIKVGDCLFLFANNLNMLFSINIPDGTLTFLGGIPDEHLFSKGLTCKLIYVKEHIIVVPLLAKKIWIYSLKSGEWKSVAVDVCRVYGRGTYFRQAIQYKDSLFFIGGHYPAILKMDLPSCKLTYLKEPFQRHSECEETEELYFRGDFVYKEGTVYLASGRDNAVLMYHLNTHVYKWIEIGKKENRYSGIMWDGNDYWLSPRKNTPVVKWDGNGSVTEYEIPEEKRVKDIAYAGIIKRNNQIIIPALARSGADTIILTDNGSMEFDRKEYTFYKKTEKGDYLAQDSDGQILFSSPKGIKRQYKYELSGKILLDFLNCTKIDINDIAGRISRENDPFSLSSLLCLMRKTKVGSVQKQKNDGLKIWEMIKR